MCVTEWSLIDGLIIRRHIVYNDLDYAISGEAPNPTARYSVNFIQDTIELAGDVQFNHFGFTQSSQHRTLEVCFIGSRV